MAAQDPAAVRMGVQGVSLTFKRLYEVAATRSVRWHGALDAWSPSDWAVALAGEVGELCNAVKKWNRIRDGAANVNDAGRMITSEAEAVAKIGDELADVIIYAPSLAARLGIDLEAVVAAKFNAVSERYGFPERLGVPATRVADDGTIRQVHYGAGRQPWDDIVAAGWAPAFAAGNVLKYLRRSKEPEHSLESAHWYWARLREMDQAHDVRLRLGAMLTDDEQVRLTGGPMEQYT